MSAPRKLMALLVSLLVILAPGIAHAQSVNTPTQEEIIDFYRCHDYNLSTPASFATSPSATQPYAPGALSQETMRQGLNYLNLVRYVAGVSSTIGLSDEYNELAQAGSLVMAANGVLAHDSKQPVGMDTGLYNLGLTGTSSSNIGMGYDNIVQSLEGYLSDSGSSNVDRVGHRRWLLNPTMGEVGFGFVNRVSSGGSTTGFTCTYVFDRSDPTGIEGIAWPARNTPVELFNAADAMRHYLNEQPDPWSYSMPADWFGSNPTVTLTRKSDGRVWNFSKAGSDGELYVSDTNSYGRLGAIIFRPEGVEAYAPGDSYTVKIVAAGGTASYTVDFFSMTSEPSVDISLADLEVEGGPYVYNGSAQRPGVTVTLNGRTLEQGKDYGVSYGNNIHAGSSESSMEPYVRIYGLGAYGGEMREGFEIEPRSIAGATVAQLADHDYTGSALRPVPTVTVGGKKLVQGTDFTCTYANNVNVGTASVTIRGMGDYAGSLTRTFKIVKPKTATMYRLYNRWTGEHFYTASTTERDSLKAGGWTYEGVGWIAPTSGDPVYRLYNPWVDGGDHHYTTSAAEYNALAALGWRQEGVGWRSGGSVPLYRQYNKYATTGTHNYTPDKAENDALVAVGWKAEGIGWYAVRAK